ncbi:MAG TPA: hypothetical protein VEM40_06395 [Nitrospirota bacterium]|nr:hypothetical protein [Nitrospirota bacterium]
MTKPQTVRSYEYKNDFLYIIIRQTPEQGPNAYLYCCGINISRFDPICWGKAGICSNPAFKGLQLLRADVSAFAKKIGVQVKNAENVPCGPMSPHGDGWYRENALMIDEASPRAIEQILEFSVKDLIQTVMTVCAPEAKLPDKLPNPPAMQKFLESLSVKDYKAAAPPPIARKQEQDSN